MQAECVYNVRVSTHVKKRPRKEPIWELRIRTDGRDTTRTIGKAWIDQELWAKKGRVKHLQSRPKDGYVTRSQAEIAAQEIVNQAASYVPDDIKTFGRAAEEYLDYAENEKGLRRSTLFAYRQTAKRLGKRPWRELTWAERPMNTFAERDLLALRDEMKKAGLAAHTLNTTRGVLRGIFGERAVIEAWKWSAVRKKESKGKIRFYTPEEVRILKAHALTDLDRAIYTVATELGLRISEIRGLKVSQVDYEAGIVRIEDAYTTTGGHAGTKGHKVRAVPLTKHTIEVFHGYCDGRSRYYEDGSEALVFEGDATDGTVGYYGLRRRLIAAERRAGLHRITLHELRHTFGTQMMANRIMDIVELQEVMGHEDITTTRIYTHFAPKPDLGARMSSVWDEPVEAEVIPLRAAS